MKHLKNILISVVIVFLLYYFMLPPINLTSPLFWVFAVLSFLIILFGVMISNLKPFPNIVKISRKGRIIGISLVSLIGLLVFINFILSPLFISKQYSKRISVREEGVFTDEVEQVNFDAIPLLDKNSSRKLGDRVMGQMPELVSQFTVSNLYTQINYNNEIIRVTPLEYNGLIKYFTNRKNGVKGYITVDSVNGEAKLTKLEKGMKYMPSALFFENLDRYVRFKYPTAILDQEYFEIDNEGNPYWVIPTISYKGIGLRKDINGVILVNPINGETKKYKIDEVPTWIDHVYSAELIIEQVDDWGKYRDGFFNSVFGQKNVVATTEGYNYTVMNDDVYLYTGITSVSNDESNLGFILTNMRTKETNFYAVPGAEEYSAMASAEGQVQQMKYDATFPLLINLNNRATYLLSLKDAAGLVKMYAFVDVADYQKVVVTDASKGIEEAVSNYLNNVDLEYSDKNSNEKNITIKVINTAILEGNTYYYITDSNGERYTASIKLNKDLLPFLSVNDEVKVKYIENKKINTITQINNK